MTEPGVEQSQLRRVGVLELIDEEVLESPALDRSEGGVQRDFVGEAFEEVLEVEEREAAFLLLVVRVPLGDVREVGEGYPASRLCLGDVVGGLDQPRLGPFDFSGDRGEEFPPAAGSRATGRNLFRSR